MSVPEVHVCDEKKGEKRSFEQDLQSRSSEGHRKTSMAQLSELTRAQPPAPAGKGSGCEQRQNLPFPARVPSLEGLPAPGREHRCHRNRAGLPAGRPSSFPPEKARASQDGQLGDLGSMMSFQWLWQIMYAAADGDDDEEEERFVLSTCCGLGRA